jgi:hypothetical protein
MARSVSKQAGRKLLAFIRSLARRGKGRKGRDWTRESLYDERIEPWTKS